MPPAGKPYTRHQLRTDRACLLIATVIGAITATAACLIARAADLF